MIESIKAEPISDSKKPNRTVNISCVLLSTLLTPISELFFALFVIHPYISPTGGDSFGGKALAYGILGVLAAPVALVLGLVFGLIIIREERKGTLFLNCDDRQMRTRKLLTCAISGVVLGGIIALVLLVL